MDVHALFHQVMEQAAAGADNGACTCVTFPHISEVEGWVESAQEAIGMMYDIVRLSPPEEAESNLTHFLTALMAVGYSLGASDTYDTVTVSVPDSLAGLDFVEARPGESRDSE